MDTRRSDVVRVHRMLSDQPDFEPCCPVLWRYFGEARPVAATIAAGRIDGRAKVKIEGVGVTEREVRAR